MARSVSDASARRCRGLGRILEPGPRRQSAPSLCNGRSRILRTEAATGSQIDRLGAWSSAHRGDHRSERKELERLLGESPGDLPALDRLARLAEMASQPEQAQAFRTRAAEIKRLRARYEHLFDRNQPVRDAEEMADLAERLGRTFEARGFLTVEIAEDPEREDLRRKLEELRESSNGRGRTWQDAG